MVVGKSQKIGGLAIQYTVFLEFFPVSRFLNHAAKSILGLEKDRGSEPSTFTKLKAIGATENYLAASASHQKMKRPHLCS
ncbi:hypothetical protein VNO77_33247 [Canavalia gladiata]|uniref:Uncharacterized protein n=1 Tax=Canavalia gladiata TaxID=3824 RepID=A0AAN9PW75_CANGL